MKNILIINRNKTDNLGDRTIALAMKQLFMSDTSNLIYWTGYVI